MIPGGLPPISGGHAGPATSGAGDYFSTVDTGFSGGNISFGGMDTEQLLVMGAIALVAVYLVSKK